MHYLYGSKKAGPLRLVATFGSEQQLLAYVRWATLKSEGERRGKFEQGSALATSDAWESSNSLSRRRMRRRWITIRRRVCCKGSIVPLWVGSVGSQGYKWSLEFF